VFPWIRCKAFDTLEHGFTEAFLAAIASIDHKNVAVLRPCGMDCFFSAGFAIHDVPWNGIPWNS
jgi:hypothetical protein